MKLSAILSLFLMTFAVQSQAAEEFVQETDLKPLTQNIVHTEEDLTRAELVIIVNKSTVGTTAQRASVYKNGELIHRYKVSTGREKLEVSKSGREYRTTTPQGYFRPTSLERDHFSETWQAHMEYAVFFVGGVALHATTEDHYKDLGKRASGGCVRLKYENARDIFETVRSTSIKDVQVLDRDGSDTGETDNNYDVLVIVENVQD